MICVAIVVASAASIAVAQHEMRVQEVRQARDMGLDCAVEPTLSTSLSTASRQRRDEDDGLLVFAAFLLGGALL